MTLVEGLSYASPLVGVVKRIADAARVASNQSDPRSRATAFAQEFCNDGSMGGAAVVALILQIIITVIVVVAYVVLLHRVGVDPAMIVIGVMFPFIGIPYAAHRAGTTCTK